MVRLVFIGSAYGIFPEAFRIREITLSPPSSPRSARIRTPACGLERLPAEPYPFFRMQHRGWASINVWTLQVNHSRPQERYPTYSGAFTKVFLKMGSLNLDSEMLVK